MPLFPALGPNLLALPQPLEYSVSRGWLMFQIINTSSNFWIVDLRVSSPRTGNGSSLEALLSAAPRGLQEAGKLSLDVGNKSHSFRS